MRKKAAILMSAILTAAMLGACGNSENAQKSNTDGEAGTEDAGGSAENGRE